MDHVSGYLRRIGWTGPVRADAATLAALHRAHLAAVPYENLDIQLGRPLSLAPAALHDKIVTRRRGGFCFELNGAFGLLLGALGFAVRWVLADRAGFEEVLRGEFDVSGDIGAAEVDRLWARTVAQHEAWRAEREGAVLLE